MTDTEVKKMAEIIDDIDDNARIHETRWDGFVALANSYIIAKELLKYYRPIDEDRRKLLHEMYEQGRFDAIADLEKEGKVVVSKDKLMEEGLKMALDFITKYKKENA